MDFKYRNLGKWLILDISGHIKGSDVSQFRAVIQRCLDEGKIFIVANLQEVGFIDSSGVGMLISCHQDLKGSDGQLVLMNLSDDIYDLFEMTSIDRLFEIIENESELVL